MDAIQITANPDLEQLKLMMWISGILLFLLLGIIGYFLKQQIDTLIEVEIK